MSGKRLLADRRARNVASCAGKERFTSFSLATRLAKKRSRAGKKNHVYKCTTCIGFHLGSPLRRPQTEDVIQGDEVLA